MSNTNSSAADQPTTEASVVERAARALRPWMGSGLSAMSAARTLAEAGLLAPAPQPAADTERDEQLREDGLRRIRERVATAHTYGSTGINAWASRYASDVPWLLAEVARQAAVIQAVRDYHATGCLIPGCSDCAKVCRGCGLRTPCPTVRALDGGAA